MPPSDRVQTLQQAAAQKLTLLARRLGPGVQLPTVAQLRQELQVSNTTLIGVLGDLESRGILTRRHGVGLFVARDVNRRSVVLLCASDFFQGGAHASPFWPQFVQCAWKVVNENNASFALHFIGPDERHELPTGSENPRSIGDALASDIRQGRIHGVLGAGVTPCLRVWLEIHRIPLVAFAAYAPHRAALDFASGVRLGVEALAARGCRRIALWTAGLPDSVAHNAFRETLAHLGLPFEAELLYDAQRMPESDSSALRRGEDAVLTAFGPGSSPSQCPDGVFCAEDTLARGALPALLYLGIRPGVDLPFATHANADSPLLSGFDRDIIRVEMDPARLVAEMYALLEALMDGNAAEEELITLAPTVRLPSLVSS